MGASINEQFSQNPKGVEIGLVSGSASALQFEDKPAKLLRFKAGEGNENVFLLGDASGVGLFPLGAGDDSGWIPANNMNEYSYQNASGTSDTLAYWRLY